MVIEYEDVPPLRSPVLIAAFEGWNDAADAASGVVDHLLEVWESRLVAVIDPQDFYDFQDACIRTDKPAVSFWAAVPHYVAQPPCPKATLALLGQLEDLLEVSIPLGDLPEESRAWERGVDELAEEDEDVGDYVRALEESRDTAELPEASGEAIAREFERYLKRRGDDDPEPS